MVLNLGLGTPHSPCSHAPAPLTQAGRGSDLRQRGLTLTKDKTQGLEAAATGIQAQKGFGVGPTHAVHLLFQGVLVVPQEEQELCLLTQSPTSTPHCPFHYFFYSYCFTYLLERQRKGSCLLVPSASRCQQHLELEPGNSTHVSPVVAKPTHSQYHCCLPGSAWQEVVRNQN